MKNILLLALIIFSACLVKVGGLMQTWISINNPVAAIQMDVTTTVQPRLDPSITTKQITTAPISGGYRCIIYGLNQSLISGKIVIVDGVVTNVSGVVAGDASGQPVSVTVSRISSPAGITATVN